MNFKILKPEKVKGKTYYFSAVKVGTIGKPLRLVVASSIPFNEKGEGRFMVEGGSKKRIINYFKTGRRR